MAKTFDDVAGTAPSVRRRVLLALRDGGPMTRAQLARETGLASATLTGTARTLLQEGVLVEAGPALSPVVRTGPRGTTLRLNPSYAHVLGVDVGFRTMRVLVTDCAGQAIGYAEDRLQANHRAADALPRLGRLASEALSRAGCAPSNLLGAGVAVRAPVDGSRRAVTNTGEMPGWAGVTSADLESVLGCAAVLENDANLAALGEFTFGASRGASTSIAVKMHSGVGAGLIVGGVLVSGRHGGAGEIGHVGVRPRGAACRCGKRGCLDTIASIPAILARTAPNSDEDLAAFLARVREGDVAAGRALREAAALVGQVLVTANLLLVPERVVVVGALVRAGEVVLDEISAQLRAGAVPGTRTVPHVVRGELGDRATVLGAAALVLRSSGWLGPGAAHAAP